MRFMLPFRNSYLIKKIMSDIPSKKFKIAIIHDYLIQMGGAEQVIASLHRIYPKATIYTSLVDRKHLMADLQCANIKDTWMRLIPGVHSRFKRYFLLYPFAFKYFGRIDADVAIISSSGFAKWVSAKKGCATICYCYTPPRFFWEPDVYLQGEVHNPMLRAMARILLAPLRRADYAAAQKVQHIVAISKCVQDRIKKYYKRDSTIIFPPVNIDSFALTPENDGYYLVASRLLGYKRIDIVIQAFARNGKRLVVVGDGPDRKRLESMAAPNIQFIGWVSRSDFVTYMQRAYALIFPGLEDFGITPVEANACGKPVLAYAGGGALETIIRQETGLFFAEQTPFAINDTLEEFESTRWNSSRIRSHAERFSERRFHNEFNAFVEKVAGVTSPSHISVGQDNGTVAVAKQPN